MTGSARISESFSVLLNLVRFFCSQGVVIGHLCVFFEIQNRFFLALPSYCVLMFFVLSGFLISYSLKEKVLSNPNYSFSDYFRDRFFRIYPPFVAALLLVFLLDMIGFQITGQFYSLKIYIGNFFINFSQLQEYPLATYINEHYMIEFFRFHYFGTNLPLWTISIEWWLYLFYGFVFFLISKSIKLNIWTTFLLILLSITPVYYMLVDARMEKGLTLYWFLGAIISLQSAQEKSKGRILFYLFSIMLVLSMTGFFVLGYNASILLFFLSLFLLARTSKEDVRLFHPHFKRLTEKLAGYSYSLYLVHYSVIYFITTVFHFEFTVLDFIVVFAIVNIIAFLFAEIFEKQSKKWKIKYENYRSGKH